MKVGERIKQLRNNGGQSLDDLSGIAGISKSGLWEIESGRTDPRFSTVVRISAALGVSVADIACVNDDPLSPRERRVIAAMRSDA